MMKKITITIDDVCVNACTGCMWREDRKDSDTSAAGNKDEPTEVEVKTIEITHELDKTL